MMVNKKLLEEKDQAEMKEQIPEDPEMQSSTGLRLTQQTLGMACRASSAGTNRIRFQGLRYAHSQPVLGSPGDSE